MSTGSVTGRVPAIVGQALFLMAWALALLSSVGQLDVFVWPSIACGFAGVIVAGVGFILMRPTLGGLGIAGGATTLGGLVLGLVLVVGVPGGDLGLYGIFIGMIALAAAISVGHLLVCIAMMRRSLPMPLVAMILHAAVLIILVISFGSADRLIMFGMIGNALAHVFTLVALSLQPPAPAAS